MADLREFLARAIYAKRPFRMAVSSEVLTGTMIGSTLTWDAAPAYYQDECLDFADVVIGACEEQFGWGWAPVETAPKDGSRFITYSPGSDDPYDFAQWEAEDETFTKWGCGWDQVTLWRPMPEPPKGALAHG